MVDVLFMFFPNHIFSITQSYNSLVVLVLREGTWGVIDWHKARAILR